MLANMSTPAAQKRIRMWKAGAYLNRKNSLTYRLRYVSTAENPVFVIEHHRCTLRRLGITLYDELARSPEIGGNHACLDADR
jgi:hypothetical protein